MIPSLEAYVDNHKHINDKADKVHDHDDKYYTKEIIDEKLKQIDVEDIDLSNYVTLPKLEEELSNKANLDDVYNKEEVDNLIENLGDKDHTHTGYLTKEEADDLYAPVNDTYDILTTIEGLQSIVNSNKTELQNNIDTVKDSIADLENEYLERLNDKADKQHEHNDTYYTKTEMDTKLAQISGGGSIDLEGYAKQEDLNNLIVQVNQKADKDHIHDLSIEDIEGLQEALNNKSNKDDVVDVPDNIIELLNQKADIQHSHDDYAKVEHVHNVNNIEGLQDELDRKANIEDVPTEEEIIDIINNNVDIEIDPEHTHDEYALKDHEHDNYADVDHTHNDFANKEHVHKISEITNLESELNKKANANMVYTKEEVDKKIIDAGSGGVIDLGGYVKQSELYDGLATKADLSHGHGIYEIDDLQDILNSKADADSTVNKAELEEVLGAKADTEHVHDEYADVNHSHDEFYTKEESEELIKDTYEKNISNALTLANIYADDAVAVLTQGAPEDMNTFAEVVKAIEDQNSKMESFEQDMEVTLAGKANAEHVHTEYATVKDEDEREIFRTTELTVSALGGISAGSNLDGLTVKEILNKLLYPYVAPTISISGTPNGGVYEKGDNQVITNARVVVTKRSEKITKIEVLQGNTLLASQEDESIANGGTFNFSVDVPVNSINIQLTGKVTDASGTTRQSTTTAFTFIYPYYVGVCNDSDTINESLIKGLAKRIESKGTKNISYTTNNQRMILAYPKSYGVIKKILDPNNFDVTSTFTQMEMKITGLDGTAQNYYVYVNGASSVEDFTMTFNY